MTRELIDQTFKKAEKETGSKIKSRLAQYLSDLLVEDYKYQISERRLRDYYTNYIEKDTEVFEDLKPQLILHLCNYLGYENYADFVVENPSTENSGNEILKLKINGGNLGIKSKYKNRIYLIFLTIVFSGLTYFGFVKEEKKCMIWKENHFEKTVCTGQPLSSPLNELILEKFKKIEHLDSIVARKNKNKELWYDKSNGEVEFFTYHGYHPITKKPLKNVTDYIIETYVLRRINDSLPSVQ